MKAAQLNDYGGTASVKVNEASKPGADKGKVLVEVYAAAVNPFDVKLTDGSYGEIFKQLPATVGTDVAGTVAEIGEDVTGFEIGQAVYGMANGAGGQGSFAEFTPVKAEQLAPKPASIDFVAAAALPLAGVSAYQALVDHMDLQAGQKILIHGGAGGIGSLAIQIAKNLSAHVAATASADDADFVKSLGADEVIDYKTQDFSTMLKDYDAVFDTVGGETNAKSYQVLKTGGAFVSMLEAPNEELVKQKEIHYTQESSQATPERLNAVAKLVDAGKLKVNVDKAFPFEQAATAMEHLKTGHPRGKVVIQVKNG
jgi:NADPH:quinone reductase-like Zn-dependent oxidoreductase